jgi:hypothetical protein
VKLQESLHQGVLHHVLRLLGRSTEVKDAVIQTVLVAAHQFPERRPIAIERVCD